MRAAPTAFVLLACLTLAACAGTSGPRPDDSGVALAGPQELLADTQMRSGRPDLALWAYDRALRSSPGEPSLSLKRARALLRLDKGREALAAADGVLAGLEASGQNSPLMASALQIRGEALNMLARAKEAQEALERAVALEPDSWRSRGLLGMALQGQGRHQAAAEQYRTALGPQCRGRIAALPEERRREVRADLANSLGVALVLAGDLPGGEVIFRKARERGLGTERVCNNLGLLLVRLGRPQEALEAFRAGGDEARALNNLGWALLLRGDRGRARALFEKALEAAPAYYETAGENLRRAALAEGREKPARGEFPGVTGVSITVPQRDLDLSLLEPGR